MTSIPANRRRPAGPDVDGEGTAMHSLVTELYPICRSITGNGVRDTLAILGRRIPLTVREVPTGTQVFDWTVPREWNIRDAYVKDSTGERVIDFRRSNLHVVNYSVPVRATMTLDELRPHLFSLPDHPAWIPYRTSYYQDAWGFCLSHSQLLNLRDDRYEVCIDTSLTDGHLTYAECYLAGATSAEVLISCHVCHPSLCNDNLSGVVVAAFLAGELLKRPRRHSYRFLFIPGTIGAITWLAQNRDCADRIRHGLVLTCVGDRGPFHYKRSRRGNTEIDRAVAHVLAHRGAAHELRDFSPYGYDERQFCSPGFDLPVGCLMRSVWGEFPEYHSSADDPSFVSAESLVETLHVCLDVTQLLDDNLVYRSTNPFCEPALGRRGLYGPMNAEDTVRQNLARLWVLNLADGHHSLLEVADRAGINFALVRKVAEELKDHGLLVAVDPSSAAAS